MQMKRDRGRPPVPKMLSKNVKRAFVLYVAAEHYRNEHGLSRNIELHLTTSQLIDLAKSLYPCRGIFDKPVDPNKMLASIKRGREILGIKKGWRGPEPQSLLNRKKFKI